MRRICCQRCIDWILAWILMQTCILFLHRCVFTLTKSLLWDFKVWKLLFFFFFESISKSSFHRTYPQNAKWLIRGACVWEELQSSCHYLEASCTGNCERMTTGWPALRLIFLWLVQHLPAGQQPNFFLTASAGVIDARRPLMVRVSECQAALSIQYSLLKLI